MDGAGACVLNAALMAVSVWQPRRRERLARAMLRMAPIKHGRHRILDRLPISRRPDDDHWALVEWKGAELLLDLNDLIGWHFAMLGTFDPEVIDVLVASPAEGADLLWDIGANCGTSAIQILARSTNVRVIAIEPQRAMQLALRQNLSCFDESRWQIVDKAIGVERSTLYLSVPAGNKGRATLQAGNDDSGSSYEVEVVTPDDIREATGGAWPTLIKIDVEGWEAAVLAGLRPAFASRVPRLVVFENNFSSAEEFRAIAEMAHSHGYAVFSIVKTPWETLLDACHQHDPTVMDYVAIRRDLVPPIGARRLRLRDLG